MKQQNNEFYGEIVENLKKEAVLINNRLKKLSEKNDSHSNIYISLVKALRDILDLIKKYDWQLMYSEYSTNSIKTIHEDESYTLMTPDGFKNNKDQKQIAIWEQNHEGNIRNHKVWNLDKIKHKGCETTNRKNDFVSKIKLPKHLQDEDFKVYLYIDEYRLSNYTKNIIYDSIELFVTNVDKDKAEFDVLGRIKIKDGKIIYENNEPYSDYIGLKFSYIII